jgi:cell envelope opacity-associated protein A
MIVKGGSRAGPVELAAHLLRVDTNERAEVVELRDVAALGLRGALCDMQAMTAANRGRFGLYHASINPEGDYERLTPAQWERCVDVLEHKLGLEGQPRAVVRHVKEGREHTHVVWQRTDADTLTLRSDSQNFAKHKAASRQMERELGHRQTPELRNPDRLAPAEERQAVKTGLKPKEIKAALVAAWESTQTGEAFKTAIEAQGFVLARGDRRDFIFIDSAGGTHSRVPGAKAADIRARLADVDAASLPSVEQGRAMALEARPMRQEKPEQERAPELEDFEGLDVEAMDPEDLDNALQQLAWERRLRETPPPEPPQVQEVPDDGPPPPAPELVEMWRRWMVAQGDTLEQLPDPSEFSPLFWEMVAKEVGYEAHQPFQAEQPPTIADDGPPPPAPELVEAWRRWMVAQGDSLELLPDPSEFGPRFWEMVAKEVGYEAPQPLQAEPDARIADDGPPQPAPELVEAWQRWMVAQGDSLEQLPDPSEFSPLFWEMVAKEVGYEAPQPLQAEPTIADDGPPPPAPELVEAWQRWMVAQGDTLEQLPDPSEFSPLFWEMFAQQIAQEAPEPPQAEQPYTSADDGPPPPAPELVEAWQRWMVAQGDSLEQLPDPSEFGPRFWEMFAQQIAQEAPQPLQEAPEPLQAPALPPPSEIGPVQPSYELAPVWTVNPSIPPVAESHSQARESTPEQAPERPAITARFVQPLRTAETITGAVAAPVVTAATATTSIVGRVADALFDLFSAPTPGAAQAPPAPEPVPDDSAEHLAHVQASAELAAQEAERQRVIAQLQQRRERAKGLRLKP